MGEVKSTLLESMVCTNGLSGNWDNLFEATESLGILHYSFDFWNTISFSNPDFKEKRANYVRSIVKENLSTNEVNQAFEKIAKECNRLMEYDSRITLPKVLYQQVLSELIGRNNLDIDALLQEVEYLFLQNPPTIQPNFFTCLESLNKAGKTFSITSNTAFIPGSAIRKYLTAVGLSQRFEFCLFSDEVGFAKPGKDIFEQLVNKAKQYHLYISNSEILHIGDNYETDVLGAINYGIQSFQINTIQFIESPRYSVHSIKDIQNIPISPEEYSRFKYGDFFIAQKYGTELFDYFITNHLNDIEEGPDSIIVYSSPYSYIPTSSFYMTYYFFELLDDYIKSKSVPNAKMTFGKINRCQTYTEDYGAMNAFQRYNLIQKDTYSFANEPNENSLCIFVDDISITGSHQRVIENMIKSNKFINKFLFLYYAKLDNFKVPASFENHLNFAYVNSVKRLIELLISDTFKNTTRTTKFILSLDSVDLNFLIQSLLQFNKHEIIYNLYHSAVLNNYNQIEIYKNNLDALILSIHGKYDFNKTVINRN